MKKLRVRRVLKTRYRKHGKITKLIEPKEFAQLLDKGRFCNWRHKAFVVLIYFSGIRVSEALRVKPEDFTFMDKLHFDVGERLKHSKKTEALKMGFELKGLDLLIKAIELTAEGKLVFPYCRKTGYNIFDRLELYPHYFRLNRLSQFLMKGYKIPQIVSWFGVNVMTIDYYTALVSIEEMAEELD